MVTPRQIMVKAISCRGRLVGIPSPLKEDTIKSKIKLKKLETEKITAVLTNEPEYLKLSILYFTERVFTVSISTMNTAFSVICVAIGYTEYLRAWASRVSSVGSDETTTCLLNTGPRAPKVALVRGLSITLKIPFTESRQPMQNALNIG